MKLLVDTNVILDDLLGRPCADEARVFFSACMDAKCPVFLTATAITTVSYLLERHMTGREAQAKISELLDYYEIAAIDGDGLVRALRLAFDDYEDAVMCQAAIANHCDAIVTRNPKDFRKAGIPVWSPKQALAAVRRKG